MPTEIRNVHALKHAAQFGVQQFFHIARCGNVFAIIEWGVVIGGDVGILVKNNDFAAIGQKNGGTSFVIALFLRISKLGFGVLSRIGHDAHNVIGVHALHFFGKDIL